MTTISRIPPVQGNAYYSPPPKIGNTLNQDNEQSVNYFCITYMWSIEMCVKIKLLFI